MRYINSTSELESLSEQVQFITKHLEPINNEMQLKCLIISNLNPWLFFIVLKIETRTLKSTILLSCSYKYCIVA